MWRIHTLLAAFFCVTVSVFGVQTYSVRGVISSRSTGERLPFVNVGIWNTSLQTKSDSSGHYVLDHLPPGMYRIQASSVGYKTYVSSEFRVTSYDYTLDIELDDSPVDLAEVSVVAAPFRRSVESPVAMRVIGVQEIEKSPGANRDISKVVNAFPGVATAVGNGYRNDLMIRGGGPSENKFYLDGVEIPNINHFSTQGASGGPVGIIDADLIREVDFYTGAFPANRGNALSSVFDFKLLDGNPDKYTFKGTVGASELAIGSKGHIGSKTTYVVSVRQSYLQLLFSLLDMPFLPRYTDAQFKIKSRFSPSHELTILGLGAIDDMKLNTETDPEDESKQYLLNYLPTIKQNTYTLGAVYKHYGGEHTQTVVVSRSFMNNSNVKYRDNDESSADNLTLNLRSDETENHFRFENRSLWGPFHAVTGVNVDYVVYTNRTFQRIFAGGESRQIRYATDLPLFKWGVFATAGYKSADERFSASLGFRLDGCDYSSLTRNPLKQFSPRLSLSYNVAGNLYVNGSIGRFYQLPAYTTLGFREEGVWVNRSRLKYVRSDQAVVGMEYYINKWARVTVEGFYKRYTHSPLSLVDSIPLACKGTDYGVSGNEAAASTARGRAYGVEVMWRWFGMGRFSALASYTWYRSQFEDPATGRYIPSAWDYRHLFTLSGSYKLPKNWDIGLKFRLMGGAPYTPYDEYVSSLVPAWDATARPYYDYDRYNTGRLKTFYEADIRVDKSFYFKGVMLGFYIDLQNVLNFKYDNPPLLISTGESYVDDTGKERYHMKYIAQQSGVILPTLGITVEF